jgi:hypothetical protein
MLALTKPDADVAAENPLCVYLVLWAGTRQSALPEYQIGRYPRCRPGTKQRTVGYDCLSRCDAAYEVDIGYRIR